MKLKHRDDQERKEGGRKWLDLYLQDRKLREDIANVSVSLYSGRSKNKHRFVEGEPVVSKSTRGAV